MRKIFVGVAVTLFSAFSLAMITPTPIADAAKCGGSDSSFLDFPTWYRGLECSSPDTIEIAQGVDPSTVVFTVALNIIDIILRVIGIIAVGFVIWGGFQYIISRGEPERSKAGLVTIRTQRDGSFVLLRFS